MRKWFKRKLPALLLMLCLVGAMLPTAFAASNVDIFTRANEYNNFLKSLSVSTPGEIRSITIKATGAHAHEIYQETVGTLTSNQSADYYYAAILPAGGGWSDVRYTKLENRNGTLKLTYRWNFAADQLVHVMVVEPVLVSPGAQQSNGGGNSKIYSTLGQTQAIISHTRGTNATYRAPFITTLAISNGLANVAKTFLPYQRYKSFWDGLSFTCYVRLPEAMEIQDINSIDFVGDTPFYIVKRELAVGPEKGVNITCQLKGWGTPAMEATVNGFYDGSSFDLRKEMQITGTATITGAKIEALVAAGQTVIHTVGSTTLSGFPQIALTPGYVKDPYTPGEAYGNDDSWMDKYPEWATKESLQVPAQAYPIKLIVTDAPIIDPENPDIPIADPGQTGVGDLLNYVDHIAYMQGDDKNTFRPYANITRAEVVQMFYNLLLQQDVDTSRVPRYNDVPNNAWYSKAVYALSSLGIVNGVGGGDFAPYRNITRAEFAVIAVRFAKNNYQGPATMSFSDVPTTYWAYNEITRATSYGWIEGNGYGQFLPLRNLSRAEAATITNRMLRRLGDHIVIDESQIIRRFPDVAKGAWFYYQVYEATTGHDYHFNDIDETWPEVYPWDGFWKHW